MPNAKAKGRGRTELGETGQSETPRPLERRVGPRIGPTLRPPTEPKRKRAAQPETRAKAERGNHGPDGLHHAGLEHRWAGTNRHTANDNQSPKKHVVQTDAYPSSTATAK